MFVIVQMKSVHNDMAHITMSYMPQVYHEEGLTGQDDNQ